MKQSKGKIIISIFILTIMVLVCVGCSCSKNDTDDGRIKDTTVDKNESAKTSNTTANQQNNSTSTQNNYNGNAGPLLYKEVSKGSGAINLKDGSTQSNVCGGFKIYQYNIETGNKTEIFSFTNNAKGFGTTIAFDTPYIPCYQIKEVFSKDMSKMAVSWLDTSDNSHRVGWVDKNGTLTDITSLLHPTTSDFSSRVPYDTSAVFTPDGYFMFSDHNSEKYVYVDLNGKNIVKEEPVLTKKSLDVNNPTRIWDVFFLPDGSKTEILEVDNIGSYDAVYFQDYKVLVSHTKKINKGVTGFDFIDEGVVVGVIRTMTGNSQAGNGVGKYGVGYTQISQFNEYPYNGDYMQLTPQTDYDIDRTVYNNGRIAFTGKRGTERRLFVVNDGNGEQEVKQVAQVPTDEQLLFWR